MFNSEKEKQPFSAKLMESILRFSDKNMGPKRTAIMAIFLTQGQAFLIKAGLLSIGYLTKELFNQKKYLDEWVQERDALNVMPSIENLQLPEDPYASIVQEADVIVSPNPQPTETNADSSTKLPKRGKRVGATNNDAPNSGSTEKGAADAPAPVRKRSTKRSVNVTEPSKATD